MANTVMVTVSGANLLQQPQQQQNPMQQRIGEQLQQPKIVRVTAAGDGIPQIIYDVELGPNTPRVGDDVSITIGPPTSAFSQSGSVLGTPIAEMNNTKPG